MAKRYVFVSYARQDASTVLPIVGALTRQPKLRALNVDVWIDIKDLQPGEPWELAIRKALRECIGILVFVSPAAMQSSWASKEITAAAENLDRFIIPVILETTKNLPAALSRREWIDLSGRRSKVDLRRAARQIADAIEVHLKGGAASPVTPAKVPKLAATIAEETRGTRPADANKKKAPNSAFLVHGHDSEALSEMEAYLTDLGIKTFILSRVEGPVQSLLQKFFASAGDAQFAIVILSADDLGASRIQYETEGVADLALQFRGRQNVILELGFFYGRLGWENVFVLYRPPKNNYPNFERPSDLDGVVFDKMEASGLWRKALAQKLSEAGFRLKRRPKQPKSPQKR